jgi:integrase
MTTAAPSAALATIQPVFTDPERLAFAGYLAGYRGLTREAYALDLRQFTTWCRARSLNLFAVRRADIESFARELEAKGRARATVTRRLSIAGFYKYAVEEELLDHSPAAHVRRPRVDYESHAVALDRNELGALLVAAGLGPLVPCPPSEHPAVSRASAATAAAPASRPARPPCPMAELPQSAHIVPSFPGPRTPEPVPGHRRLAPRLRPG